MPDGFDRYAIWSARTGCIYWKGAKKDRAKYNYDGGYKYDPATNKVTRVQHVPNVRASTGESSKGIVYGFTRMKKHWALYKQKGYTMGPEMGVA